MFVLRFRPREIAILLRLLDNECMKCKKNENFNSQHCNKNDCIFFELGTKLLRKKEDLLKEKPRS